MHQDMHRGATAEIDLNAISHNYNVIKKITGNLPVIAVVKADAYGHGAAEISESLVKEGVFCLAVAYTSEAIELRKAGIKAPVLVLFEKYDIPDFFEYNLIPVIHDLNTAEKISEEAKKKGRSIDLHVKIDTGMGRVGFNSDSVAEDLISISKMDYINIAGLMSHFSDSDMADKSYAGIQLKRFRSVREKLRSFLGSDKNLLCHISNSAATMSFRDAHMDAVRPGIMLYGCLPFQQPAIHDSRFTVHEGTRGQVAELIPAMTVKARILTLKRLPEGSPVSYGRTFITRRDSLVAILAVGYADGFSRVFSNNADVLVRGKRAPIIGRVCMDLTMVDVTEVEGLKEGDEVVLLGRDGNEEITVWEMALKANTIPYEVLTSIGNKSKRIYKDAGCRMQDTSSN